MQPDGVQATSAPGRPRSEQARVDRVEAVDVLARVDESSTRCASMPFGSGSWTRMPSIAGSALSCADEGDELGLARRRGQDVQLAAHADLVRGLLLVARVDGARGIVADEHDVEPRNAPVLRAERVDAGADLRANRLCQRLAVEDASAS